jgi:hypothetical protein
MAGGPVDKRTATVFTAMGTALLSATGCAAPVGAAAARSTADSLVSGGPGWVAVHAPANNPDAPALRVQGAALYPHAPGAEELRMSVTDDSAVPDHLYAITTPIAAVQLFTAPSTPGGTPQAAPATGIALDPGTSVHSGPGGPRILIRSLTGNLLTRPLTLQLVFAVAGQIPLTVTAAAATTPSPTGPATAPPTPGTPGTPSPDSSGTPR